MAAGSVFERLEVLEGITDEENFNARLSIGPEGVAHGTLANGLRYYVRKCQKPKERVAIALAVKVGSVVEEEQERGVAHIVEHLAFNATESYSNHDIVKFLESIGAQFGACQNAYTSSDETVYQLVVPSDKPGLLADALRVIGEFAFKIRCAAEDLKKERGAVLEEWRMNRDAMGRAQEAHWRLVMEGSRYADRLPIGTEGVIRGVKADVVRGFYERWYRPENMAVVVVGDIEGTDEVVDLIRGSLEEGRSRSVEPAPPAPFFSYQPHEQPRYKVFVDKEAQDPQVFVSFKHPRRKLGTPAEFLEHLLEWTFQVVLNTRLYKLSREADPPFAGGSVSDEPLCASTQSLVLSATAFKGSTLLALETLLTEVARIRLHGISDRELSYALADLRADIENTYLERDQGYCWELRDEYTRHFLNEEFVTGQDFEARLSKSLLPLVTREKVEARAAGYHPRCSCVVKVVDHKKSCSEEEVKAIVERVMKAEEEGSIGPLSGEAELPDRILQQEPEPGSVVEERRFEALDATELTLSNGMRVCLKRTPFMEDEVLLTGVAFGGLTEVPRELFYTASTSNLIAGQIGVFGLKPTVLNDVLAGKRVEMDIAEGAFTRSFKGLQSPWDLETSLQLVHALFTHKVRVDEKELDVVMRLLRQSVEAQERNPLHHYHNRVRAINYGGCYYFAPISQQDLEGVDAHIACAHHNMGFHNPAEFSVVLTGNVDRERLEPLLTRYLASIPSTPLPPPKDPKTLVPLPIAFPQEPVVEDVKVDMVSPITQSQLTFPVSLTRASAREDLVWLALACRLLETRLLQRMRFIYGEIYTVVVSPFFGCESPSNTGDPRGEVSISFTCDPKNRSRLIEMALEEVSLLQEAGPKQDEVEVALNLDRLMFEEGQQENAYWHELMVMGYQSKTFQVHRDLDKVYTLNMEARSKVLAAANAETTREAMRRLFPYPCRTRYTAIAMVPRSPPLMYRLLSGLSSLLGGGSSSAAAAAAAAGSAQLQHPAPLGGAAAATAGTRPGSPGSKAGWFPSASSGALAGYEPGSLLSSRSVLVGAAVVAVGAVVAVLGYRAFRSSGSSDSHSGGSSASSSSGSSSSSGRGR